MLRLFFTNEKTDNRIFQYFLGFQPSDGWLLVDDEKNYIIVWLDGRYYEKDLALHSRGRTIEKRLRDRAFVDVLSEVVSGTSIVTLEATMPYHIVVSLEERSRKNFTSNIFVLEEVSWQRGMRMNKSTEDILCIETAIEKTEQLWSWLEEQALAGGLLGKTELEVRGLLLQQAFSLGLEDEAFDVIVASGSNTAIPHHRSCNTMIENGPFLLDMGYRYAGRCSDMTRCLWLGDKKDHIHYKEYMTILSIVQEAHDAACAMVASGMLFADIAKAARHIIDTAGYGEYFTHALGHGVGLDVHEAPSVSVKSIDIVESGMVFTIEPGIYLPGKFGVRWETIMIVD